METVNPFPNDKILDQTKLKAFADDKLNVTKMIISVFDRVENIVGKGEIACTSNFSFSLDVFKNLLFQRHQKVSLCGNGLKQLSPLVFFFIVSGMIGSGLCVFCKFRIMETLYHKFDLNGYVHKVQHGDWFGGKGVGLAKIDVNGYILHLYVTHVS